MSDRGIIEPSKVASCRKCLHLQSASLTPELQAFVCMTVFACLLVYACVCMCVCGIEKLIVSQLPIRFAFKLSVCFIALCMCVCSCGVVAHPSALRWHITVNE